MRFLPVLFSTGAELSHYFRATYMKEPKFIRKSILLSGCVFLAGSALAWSHHYGKVEFPGKNAAPVSMASSRIDSDPILARNSKSTQPLQPLAATDAVNPPLCESFDNFRSGMEYEDFKRYFKVIDSNNDGRKWGLYNYTAADRPTGRCAYLLFPMEESNGKADDWLITRGINLEAGKYYRISADASLYREDEINETCPQTFEIKCGMYDDADGLNTLVVPTTSVSSTKFKTVDGWFVPRLSGTYYIGIHGTSPAYSSYYNYLFIDNISIDAARESTVPSTVTDLQLTNDPDGSTRIDFIFNAPATDLAGKALTDNLTITVSRDGTPVKTIEGIRPGQKCTFSDTPAEGEHTYSFRTSNLYGEGSDVTVSRYAGIATPLMPAITATSETADHQLNCRWTAPAADINGNAINPDKVTYNVYSCNVTTGDLDMTANEISATDYTSSFTFTDQKQILAMLYVSANFNGKESEPAPTEMLPIGEPYRLPYRNSFTYDDYENLIMSVENKDNAVWRMLDDLSDPASQDDDSGFISMICNEPDESCGISFGKIDLTGASYPALSFYTYIYEFDDNEININVTDMSTGRRTTVKKIVLSSLNHTGWTKILCPLESYSGKTVQISLEGVIRTHGYIPVDNMRIEQIPETDYAIGTITYPRGMESDTPFEINAQILGFGHNPSSPYTVSLLRDGKTVAQVDGPSVAMLQESKVTFTETLKAGASPVSNYTVEINASDDGNTADNVSAPFSINMIVPTYPVVTNLSISGRSPEVTLEWDAPDLSKGAPEAVLEDFESYDAFDNELGGNWTMIDADNNYVGGFQGLTMPVDNTQQAWWVMSNESPYDFLWPYSGKNLLTQMYGLSSDGKDEIPSDDWIVSPELYGGCQTVSLMASSFTSNYGLETMEIYCSKSGNDINDFELIQEECQVPSEWTQYFIYLPAGTRYFAVRATTAGGFMLRLDDIRYTPAGTPVALELKGYNVYCNDRKLNDTPISTTTFTATTDDASDRFFVTAVYDRGESAASNIVTTQSAAIDMPSVDTDATNAPAIYYDLSGRRISSRDLAPGFYLRHQGTTTSKILVR